MGLRDFCEKKQRKAERGARRKTGRPLPIAATARKAAKGFLYAAGAGGCLFTGMLAWELITSSPYLSLTDIRVAGNRVVPEEELRRIAGAEGKNILSFDVRAAGKRIEAIPWVKEVSLARELPRSFSISVQERTPLAMINLGELYYVDEEGVIFAAAGVGAGVDYPVLSGIDRKKLLSGDAESFDLLARGVELAAILKMRRGALSWETVSEIFLDAAGGVTLYTADRGVPVHMGSGSFEAKLARSERVLYDLDRKGIRSRRIDADFDDRVVVKMAI